MYNQSPAVPSTWLTVAKTYRMHIFRAILSINYHQSTIHKARDKINSRSGLVDANPGQSYLSSFNELELYLWHG